MLKAILHTRPVRQLDSIFTSGDLQRLGNTVEIIWGKDEQMPEEAWTQAKKSEDRKYSTDMPHGWRNRPRAF